VPDVNGFILNDLSFGYGTQQKIFQGASVEFRKGVTLIMGPSGCGKTTLLKIVSGIIPLDGIERQIPKGRRLLVIQEDALLPWLTGWENALLFSQCADLDKQLIEKHESFPTVVDFIHQYAWQMSYGQRRSIELLRSLLSKPRILCLDEPLNYMDPDRRAVFASAICHAKDIEHVLIATHERDDFIPFVKDALVFDGRHPLDHLQQRSFA